MIKKHNFLTNELVWLGHHDEGQYVEVEVKRDCL
jgi:hypothetical protein